MKDVKVVHSNPHICVVGAGRWGMNHIRTLDRLGYLAGISESDIDNRNRLAREYPHVNVFGKVLDAVDDIFDGFTIATPAETHFEIAKYLIERGKHVLVEKPLTMTVDEAKKLKNMAEERGVNLMVGHLLLFHPAIRKMKGLITGGKIGKLQYMYSNRLNLGAVRTEENILWSFAPHDISIFQYFTESYPIKVESCGGAFLQPHIHDSSMTILTYTKNRMGHIFVSWLHPFKEHRIIVIGSKGMLFFEDSSNDKKILFYEKGINLINGEPVTHDGPTETIPYESVLPLDEELKYFATHLDGSRVEIAGAQNAVEVMEILVEASVSLQDNQDDKVKEVLSHNEKAYFAHETAVLDQGCLIGHGTKIWHFSHVLFNTTIGDNCTIGQNCVIGPDVLVGNGCKVQNNVSIYKGVHIEDDVFCGPSMVFTNVYNPRASIKKMEELRPTLVRKGATIGANATVICGVTIGRYAFIGAGAVVSKDVPDYALMVGNPAKQIGWVCECGERLDDKMKCALCGKDLADIAGN